MTGTAGGLPTSDLAGQVLLGGDDLVHVGADDRLHGRPGQLQLGQRRLKLRRGLLVHHAVHGIRNLGGRDSVSGPGQGCREAAGPPP